MLLVALNSISEVSEKLSTGLRKTGEGPYSCAVVTEMFDPCLDPACEHHTGHANWKADAQGGPSCVCHHCLWAVLVKHE